MASSHQWLGTSSLKDHLLLHESVHIRSVGTRNRTVSGIAPPPIVECPPYWSLCCPLLSRQWKLLVVVFGMILNCISIILFTPFVY